MLYQAVFHKYGEHIHIPIEADTKEQAYGRAKQENPTLESWPLTITAVKEGEEVKDDRAELKLEASPRMGRPSQGRSYRLHATITPEQAAWLEAQRVEHGDKSLSDAVFRLIDSIR